MSEPRGRVRIVGSYLSPYVRKVLAVLHLKGIGYEIDPIVAFMGDDRFSQISPVRRIPVLMDDRVTLCDSSVICQYLEDRYPSPAIYPADVAARAQARWLEEYADTRMGDVFIWQLFNQVSIGPYVWGRPTDEAALKKTLAEEMPQVLGYLEPQVPASGFFFGALSIADISVCAFFRNAGFVRWGQNTKEKPGADAAYLSRWPKVAAYAERVLREPCFESLKPYEDKMLRTPIAKQREALAAMGAPLMKETYGTDKPRPGLMRI